MTTKSKMKKFMPTKENLMKVLAAVGVLGIGAAIFKKKMQNKNPDEKNKSA